MDWQELLSNEVKALEANGYSLEDNAKARAMLRPLRAMVQRLSRLSLRIADSSPVPPSKPIPPRLGRDGPDRRKPLYRVYSVDHGRYLDEAE